jgi:hypothetical protein
VNDEARDRLVIAEIAGTAGRHTPLSGWLPYGDAKAIAEVADAAQHRADLLAKYAGWCLGLSLVQMVDQLGAQLVAQASPAARAGADMEQVAGWIPQGIARGEQISARYRRS